MAAIRTAIIIACTSFLAGTFAVHWTQDYGTLWTSPVKDEAVHSALSYYHDIVAAPAWYHYVIYSIAGLGVLSCLTKIAQGNASRYLFDGASLFLFSSAAYTFVKEVRAGLLRLPESVPEGHMSYVVLAQLKAVASGHMVIAVALTGVVIMQAAQFYAQKSVEQDIKRELAATVRK